MRTTHLRLQVIGLLLFGLVLPLGAGCGSGGDGPSAPAPPPAGMACGPYPDQASSAYILPYPAGVSYLVGQGNCTTRSHALGSPDAYSYDLLMPIGSVIVAAAGGTVIDVVERFVDGNRTPGQENRVFVDHSDGTTGTYWHLTLNGALVEVGDSVSQGDPIALSGDTGNSSEPHLHFGVVLGGRTIPVIFRNTRPHPMGLVEGETYLAGPF